MQREKRPVTVSCLCVLLFYSIIVIVIIIERDYRQTGINISFESNHAAELLLLNIV